MLALTHRSGLTYRVEIERASVWVDPANGWVGALVDEITRAVAPDEPLFIYGHEADLYFLSGRFFAWPFAQLYPGQAGEDGGRAIARLLEARPPEYIVQGILAWPGLPPLSESVPELEAYIRNHYVHDTRFFERHAVGPGAEPPLDWVISVLRRRAAP